MINNVCHFVLAGFINPLYIATTPYAFLFALPLIAVISIVYKAIKLEKLEFVTLVRESFLLFGSILVFMIASAIVVFLFMKITIG